VLGTAHRAVLAAVTRLTAPAAAIRIEVAAASARLPDRELWKLPLRRLTLGARQRRADQPAMHWTFVVTRGGGNAVHVRGGSPLGVLRVSLRGRALADLYWRFFGCLRLVRCLFLVGHVAIHHGRSWATSVGRIPGQHAILPAARRGNPRLLVVMVRVARRAARLLHLVIDHRDDRVIGDAALARTVVVQNVTEPKPALLH
jgi:hypothetical protein